MTLCNRVSPFGAIVRTPERGAFMGNRGIIHDPSTRTLHPTRRWTHRAWIVCRCDFRGRRRTVMGQGGYTELFFLDEATALAAGHRPCFECRRADAEAFRSAWAEGHGIAPPRAAEIDAALHAQRLNGRAKRFHALPSPPHRLADGVMLCAGEAALLVRAGRPRLWSPAGYLPHSTWPDALAMLTPPSTVRALFAGYKPAIDQSALGA